MKTNYIYLGLLVLCLASCKKEKVVVDETVVKTDTIQSIPETTPDSATVAKAWTDYATPSKAHEMLAKDTGTWDAEMTFWMPETPEPQKATSVATYKMILNGKYQEGVFKGDMWGMPFEGRGTTAYDNASKQFITTWMTIWEPEC